jgi:hypothetical protein
MRGVPIGLRTWAACSAALLAGCYSSPGALMDAQDNTRFATDDSLHLVVVPDGEHGAQIRKLNGDVVRTFVDGVRFHPMGVDERGLRMVGTDSAGAFTVVAGEPVHRLDQLGYEWNASLVLNGAGTRIATTNWQEGRLRILSFDTREILHDMPCPAAAYCYWVRWDLQDPDVVWFSGKTGGFARFNFARSETTVVTDNDDPPMRLSGESALSRKTCKATGAQLVEQDNRVDLVESGKQTRTVIYVAGFRRPPFGRPGGPISLLGFLEGCRYAVFTFGPDSYLLDTTSGAKGRLAGYPVIALAAAR